MRAGSYGCPMTITIGRGFIIRAFILLLLLGGTAFASYTLGRSSRDVKAAEARGFERGEKAGQEQALRDAAKFQEDNALSEARGNEIEYLGYPDWHHDRWYVVHIIKRVADGVRTSSINDRQRMSPGLTYMLCGADSASICSSG